MKKGFFITIEGPEGGGKSTQAQRLCRFLKRQKKRVVHTREPGGTGVAEGVRHLLLDPKSRIAPWTELFLYESARVQHVAEVVRPALDKGRVVVCERYTDSTIAYQGAGRGLPRKAIQQLNHWATQGLVPDLTFLLDVPAERGLQRARSRRGRGDRLELESLRFHQKVRRGFLALAKKNPRRFVVIPGHLSLEEVQERMEKALLQKMTQRKTRG